VGVLEEAVDALVGDQGDEKHCAYGQDEKEQEFHLESGAGREGSSVAFEPLELAADSKALKGLFVREPVQCLAIEFAGKHDETAGHERFKLFGDGAAPEGALRGGQIPEGVVITVHLNIGMEKVVLR